ncbi:MAG: class I SAM-dependent methyltransferase [Chloroflexi bacterium]|nr:class I SAM-dependent methyltransferase [Chloroflexota bacterium]
MPESREWDEFAVADMWDANAPVWGELARLGYDQFRDYINAPAFMAALPCVEGLLGLDVGCGEGYHTRLVAKRGARLIALDIAPKFIEQAAADGGPIAWMIASGCAIPLADQSVDFVISTMCLMDLPDYEGALDEICRVLKLGGFLLFSILHPCFSVAGSEWQLDSFGRRNGLLVRNYFDQASGYVEEWIFGAAPRELVAGKRHFRIPRFRRTLAGWLNPLFERGLVLERLEEPHASKRQAQRNPRLAASRIVPYFMLLRCRKP